MHTEELNNECHKSTVPVSASIKKKSIQKATKYQPVHRSVSKYMF